MNWLDGLVFLNLALATWEGWRVGLVRTVLPLVGLLIGLFLALRYYLWLGERLPGSPGGVADGVAFILIMAATVAVASLLAWGVARFLSRVFLGWADRLGGGIAGLALGALTTAVALALLLKYPFLGLRASIEGSALAPRFLERLSSLLSLLPPEWEWVRYFFQ